MQYSEEQPEQAEPEYEGLDFGQYKNWWQEAVDTYAPARAQHIRDEEYYDGDVAGDGYGHWTRKQLQTLLNRNQPPVTRNFICRKVNGISGVEQRTRSEPRALPRTPKDQKAAEIATDCLRFIKEKTRWSNIKAERVLEGVKIGYAAVEVLGAEDHVPVNAIQWKEFFFDPRSRAFDFSDARYLGVAKWLDLDVAKATYAGPEIPQPQLPPQPAIQPQPMEPALQMQWAQMAQQTLMAWQAQVQQIQQAYETEVARRQKIIETLEGTAEGQGSDTMNADISFEDRPSGTWCDSKRRRVFIVDMWHADPKHGWYRCVFTGGGKLFTQPSPYKEKDQWGRVRPVHPIQAFSIHVSKDLWRYGEVRGMRPAQDEVNFRLSKKIDILYRQQLFYVPGSFEEQDVEAVRREIAKADGVIAVRDINGFKIEKNLDVAMAMDAAMAEAMRFLDLEGANPELQGRGPSGQSGRAILARQQAGLGQLGPIFDRIYDWELRCYRAMWSRVQQFWTAPMYVRVTDDKNAARFAAVNGAPVVNTDNGNAPQRPEDGAAPAMPPQMPQGGPMMGGAMAPGQPPQQETGPILAELDMDIILDRAQEAATLQAEQFEALVQLAQSGVLGPPNPETARMLITASALPSKSELLDMLDKMAAKPQGPTPEQKAQLETLAKKIEQIVAQTNKTKAETAKILGADIPGAHADAALTSAQARTENVNATMTELTAGDALALRDFMQAGGGAAFNFPPMAAASPPGALGSPPSEANGPPPF